MTLSGRYLRTRFGEGKVVLENTILDDPCVAIRSSPRARRDELVPLEIKGLKPVATVALGATVSFVLMDDGTVWGWGNGEAAQVAGGKPGSPTAPHPIVGISK